MKGWRLTIGDLMPEDEGKYTCVITNQYGSINWTFVVEIIRKSLIVYLSIKSSLRYHQHHQFPPAISKNKILKILQMKFKRLVKQR